MTKVRDKKTNQQDQMFLVRAERGTGKTGLAKELLARSKQKFVVYVEGETDVQLYEALRTRMDELGISQRELARRLKTSQQRVCSTLAGKNSPSMETVARYAQALNCVVMWTLRIEPARE